MQVFEDLSERLNIPMLDILDSLRKTAGYQEASTLAAHGADREAVEFQLKRGLRELKVL